MYTCFVGFYTSYSWSHKAIFEIASEPRLLRHTEWHEISLIAFTQIVLVLAISKDARCQTLLLQTFLNGFIIDSAEKFHFCRSRRRQEVTMSLSLSSYLCSKERRQPRVFRGRRFVTSATEIEKKKQNCVFKAPTTWKEKSNIIRREVSLRSAVNKCKW